MQKDKIIKKQKNEEKKELTQWHPAFCSAMKLELVKNKKDLVYYSEYGINSKPIQIDLLVIQKSKYAKIENEIGKIFKGHNIFEYKSPDDKLNMDTYFKVLGDACLYKAQASKVDGIVAEDITISLMRERKPVKLFHWFKKQGYDIEQRYKGIYYIKNHSVFDTQIIVLKELSSPLHLWLKSLTRHIKKETAEKLILEVNELSEKDECEYADSVLQVAMNENKEMFSKVKEVATMCEALAKLMEPEMTEAKRKAAEEGRKDGLERGMKDGMERGIEGFIKLLKKYNESEERILEEMRTTYEITEKEAKEYLDKYNAERS